MLSKHSVRQEGHSLTAGHNGCPTVGRQSFLVTPSIQNKSRTGGREGGSEGGKYKLSIPISNTFLGRCSEEKSSSLKSARALTAAELTAAFYRYGVIPYAVHLTAYEMKHL